MTSLICLSARCKLITSSFGLRLTAYDVLIVVNVLWIDVSHGVSPRSAISGFACIFPEPEGMNNEDDGGIGVLMTALRHVCLYVMGICYVGFSDGLVELRVSYVS